MSVASKVLAMEYAKNNPRFNTVPPALVNTPMHASTIPRVGATFFEDWLNHYLIENKVSQAGS
jgi:NAD(P)-dependent dehydrogenase (short-subunit alcohol dehydrogenase family)